MAFEFNLFQLNDKVRACIWEHTLRYRHKVNKMVRKWLNVDYDMSKYLLRLPGSEKYEKCSLSASARKLFDEAKPWFDTRGYIDRHAYEKTGEVVWMCPYVQRICQRRGWPKCRLVFTLNSQKEKTVMQKIPWRFDKAGKYDGAGDFTEEYVNRVLASHGLVIKRDSRLCEDFFCTSNVLKKEGIYWCIHPDSKKCSRLRCNDAVHEGGRCLKHHNDLLAARVKRAAKGK